MVFNANDAIDTAIMKPIAEGYRTVVPQFVRDRIRAFIDNLQEPRIFVNNLLQLRINDAGFTFARFYVNSTLGLAGLFDIASEHALPRQTGDFGQTLAVWGVDSGPYLVLPLVGPSNFRDAFGSAVDFYTTPPAHLVPGATGWWITVGTYAVGGIDLRSRNIETLDQIKEHALDYYAHSAASPGSTVTARFAPRAAWPSRPTIWSTRALRRSDATAGGQAFFISLSICWRRLSINAAGPPALRIAPNSERCVASSLMVPLR